MKIDRVEVDGYGHFQGLSLTLAPGLNLLYGPNEAGKSTLLSFVRSVLFGFERQNSPERYATSGAYGGKLLLSTQEGRLWVERKSVRRIEGELFLRDENGETHDPARLSYALHSLSKELYRQVFAFGLDELSDFSKLVSDRAIAEALLAAGTEGARSLPRALAHFRGELEARFKPKSPNAPLNALLRTLAATREEREGQVDLPGRYRELSEELAALESEQDSLNREREKAERQRERLARLLSGAKIHESLRLLEERFRALPDLSRVPEGAEEQLPLLVRQEEETLEGVLRIEAQEKQRRDAMDLARRDLLPEEMVAALAVAVEAMTPQVGVVQSLSRREMVALERKAHAEESFARLKASFSKEALMAADFSVGERAKLLELRERAETLSREVFRHQQTYDRTHAAQGQLPSADTLPMEEDHLSKMPHLGGLLLGVAVLLASAVAYCFYAVGPRMGGPAAVFAAALILLGGELYRRFSWTERAAILRQKHLSAQKRDEMAELLARRSSLVAEAQEAAAALQKAKLGESMVRAELDQFAAAHGFPAGLAADALLELFSELAGTRQRLLDAKTELSSLESDQVSVRQAQRALLDEVARARGPTSSWEEALTWAKVRVDKARAAAVEVKRLTGEEHGRRGEVTMAQERLSRAEVALAEFLALLGVSDVSAGMARCELARKYRSLSAEISQQKAQLFTLSGFPPEAYTEALLSAGGSSQVEREHSADLSKLQELAEQQRDLDRRSGELKTKLAQLEKGDSAEQLRAQEEELSAKVDSISEEYVSHLLSLRLLERAAQNFERTSQPRVVRKASALFSELTLGRYVNVFLPLEGGEIRVQDGRGADFRAESLSRGTREQLYLAFRLALVLDFADQKGPLPILLDDILVNFDPRRALATLRVLSRISQTHQLIAFTCHPWLRQAFSAEGAEVIDLGDRDEDFAEEAALRNIPGNGKAGSLAAKASA